MAEVSTQLDYRKIDYLHPTYRYSKILPQSGGQTVTITSAGNSETIFEIPTKAFNLPRSYLYFVMNPLTTGAGNINWLFQDTVSTFFQMQLYTRSGIYLCDIQNVSNYTKIASKPETRLQEFIDYDVYGNSTNYTESNGRFLCRSNSVANSTTNTLLAPYAGRFNNTSANIHYTEPKYLEPGTANTADPIFTISLPLGHIKNTIFNVDKDIYAGEILLLRLVWNNSNRIGFLGTSATNPVTGAAAIGVNIAITGLTLYLAVEKNQDIVNSLMTQINSTGLQILIPYIYGYKNNPGNGTSHSISYRFNRGHGIKLQKIFHSAFNNTESTNVAYDHDNKGTSKVNIFYTMLDNERLQEINLNTATFDDYNFLRSYLKGSVIQSADMYYHNWVWIEDFSLTENKDKLSSNKSSGLDLSVERKWDFYALQVNNDTAAQYNYYTFAVTQKMLTISSVGITCI
jgi:hypothetical protein